VLCLNEIFAICILPITLSIAVSGLRNARNLISIIVHSAFDEAPSCAEINWLVPHHLLKAQEEAGYCSWTTVLGNPVQCLQFANHDGEGRYWGGRGEVSVLSSFYSIKFRHPSLLRLLLVNGWELALIGVADVVEIERLLQIL
jgi:hypothetical protein